MIKSPAIEGHAVRFKSLIDKVLGQMDDIGGLSQTLQDYGVMHHSFGAQQKYATVSTSTGIRIIGLVFIR